MTYLQEPLPRQSPVRRHARAMLCALVAMWACGLQAGCAALSNPVANGVPVRLLPPELLGESRKGLLTTSLSSLRQAAPEAYQLAAGDVLGVWIEGILGEKGQAPPLHIPESGNLPPALGYPVPVRDDGTISLPFISPLRVQGMTVTEAQEAVRTAYTVTNQIIVAGRERIFVTLNRPRTYHVLVIRQDVASLTTPGSSGTQGTLGYQPGASTTGFVVSAGGGGRAARRSSGFTLELPAYQNDLLNALARTGGVPGTDVADEIVIERGGFAPDMDKEALKKAVESGTPGVQKIRIPLRYRPGDQPRIRPEDIILRSGDIVYVEAREQDVFYTAGLLPATERPLPHDTDLDVIEAIAQVGGAIDSGGLSTLNVTGTLLTNGIGNPSPSLASIVRKTAGQQQLVILVDLNKALIDPTERILIQPGDLIVLQQTPQEAIAGYFAQIFHFDLTYTFTATKHALGTLTGSQ